jgi:hypothetical protein
MNGEDAVESDVFGIFAQNPRADRVEGPRPGQAICHQSRLIWENMCRNAFHPADHLHSRPTRKGQQHNPTRVGTLHDEMRNAMGQRVRLAGSRPRDNEEWRWVPNPVLDSASLFWVELG